MRVLVACESSGVVREAFRARGHDAWSCDLQPPDDESAFHRHQDVLPLLEEGWDLMIGHPPCTHLSVSGARHFAAKRADGRQKDALEFVRALMLAPIPRIAIENPVSIIASQVRPSDQTIHPWMFGHPEQKATCLWLKNLPLLVPTNDVHAKMMELPRSERERIHLMPPSPHRWKERSKTFQGIADAMADQWGCLTGGIQADWIAAPMPQSGA